MTDPVGTLFSGLEMPEGLKDFLQMFIGPSSEEIMGVIVTQRGTMEITYRAHGGTIYVAKVKVTQIDQFRPTQQRTYLLPADFDPTKLN